MYLEYATDCLQLALVRLERQLELDELRRNLRASASVLWHASRAVDSEAVRNSDTCVRGVLGDVGADVFFFVVTPIH